METKMDVTIRRNKRKKRITRMLMLGLAAIILVRYFQYKGREEGR